MSVDPMTGRNPSYCFVDFNSEEETQRGLVELDGQTLLKRPVKTRPATKPGEGPKKYESTRERPPQDRKNAFVFNRWDRTSAEAKEHHVPAEGCRLWVGSLPSFNLNPVDVQTNIRAMFENQDFTP